jgi:hypothetical protein
MRALLPLVRDTIDALEADALLGQYMGRAPKVYTERPPDGVAAPFLTLDILSANAWNTQSYRGTEYQIQVSAFFLRTEQGGARGILDVAQTAERIRDVLDDLDNYDLPESPSEGEAVILDFTNGRFETGADNARLVLRQYTNSLPPTPDPDGKFMQAACRFRCLVGISN